MAKGKVYLVGAGPGDPGLITLRAAEVLARADVVLYDYLANPQILAHCRQNAVRISLGKHGRGRVLSQPEINELLRQSAAEHATVVRLKSGDPMVFARAGEELGLLAREGIEFEIVPGVTATVAAASCAGIPLTHRDEASAVALVTGHEDAEKTDSTLDFAALAAFPGTLVFYMGVTTAGRWSVALIAAGKPAATPVAILRRVSLPDQRRIDTSLGEVAAVVQETKLRPPVVFIVGDVAAHGGDWAWFERRPLAGKSVLVTRAAHQTSDLGRPLAELGAEVLVQPAIEIRPAADLAPLDRAINDLDRFDWLVFSSVNGVQHFFERLLATGRDLRALGRIQLAAIGPGTADELARYRLRADLVPAEFRAESLVEAFEGRPSGRRFLLVRASRGREILAEGLTAAGGQVEQVIAYESVDTAAPDPEIVERLRAGQIDWVTVTSSAIARSLERLFGDALRLTRLASLSPLTSATLRELGHEPGAEATEYTMAGLVAAIVSRVERDSHPD